MKYNSIKFKKNFFDIINVIFLGLFSFFICYYYGFNGINPLDDFVNYNCGYRILSGDIPFKDYYSITGPFLCYLQAVFYKLFGTSWSSLVIHASFFNLLLCLSFFFFLKKFGTPNYLTIIFCLCISILGYPNNGVPGVDHHSWILSLSSILFFYLGLIKKKKKFLLISTILLFLSFLVKQVPSIYILIIILFLYSFFVIKERKLYYFKELCFTSFFCLSVLIFYLNLYSININTFFEQYILLSLDLGSERFEKVNINYILEKISGIYFLFFLLIPLSFNFINYFTIKKKFEDFNLLINFFVSFSIIFISLFYEIHTNNSSMTFICLPLITFFLYEIQKKTSENKVIKILYLILVFYSWLRLIQFDFFISFLNLIFLFILISILKFKKLNLFCTQNLLLIYLVFSTFYYFQTSIEIRKYKDIDYTMISKSFDGYKINDKFKKVKWLTSYGTLEKYEIDLFNSKIGVLKSLDNNFIFISDYQIFNSILDLKDYSPVKYWHTGVSYPDKDSKYRANFENFFLNKIIQNNVHYVLIDKKASVFQEKIEDFIFFNKCSKKIEKKVNNSLKIYKLNNLCLKSIKN